MEAESVVMYLHPKGSKDYKNHQNLRDKLIFQSPQEN